MRTERHKTERIRGDQVECKGGRMFQVLGLWAATNMLYSIEGTIVRY